MSGFEDEALVLTALPHGENGAVVDGRRQIAQGQPAVGDHRQRQLQLQRDRRVRRFAAAQAQQQLLAQRVG